MTDDRLDEIILIAVAGLLFGGLILVCGFCAFLLFSLFA